MPMITPAPFQLENTEAFIHPHEPHYSSDGGQWFGTNGKRTDCDPSRSVAPDGQKRLVKGYGDCGNTRIRSCSKSFLLTARLATLKSRDAPTKCMLSVAATTIMTLTIGFKLNGTETVSSCQQKGG
jgi:hypothetical protein